MSSGRATAFLSFMALIKIILHSPYYLKIERKFRKIEDIIAISQRRVANSNNSVFLPNSNFSY